MVPQRRAHHEVGKEVAVDLVPYRCAYAPRHVALAMLCLLEVRVQGAVGVPRRRDLRDGRRICAGGCSTAPLRTTSRPRRHVLPDDDAPARSRGRCIWILIMFAREAGELLLCLINDSQGVEISVPWTFPAAFPTLPTLRPRGVTLKDCQTIGTHKKGRNGMPTHFYTSRPASKAAWRRFPRVHHLADAGGVSSVGVGVCEWVCW